VLWVFSPFCTQNDQGSCCLPAIASSHTLSMQPPHPTEASWVGGPPKDSPNLSKVQFEIKWFPPPSH
jgi:hypothetical protein